MFDKIGINMAESLWQRVTDACLLLVLAFGVGCGNNSPKCVEGASVACACPNGGSCAQVCTSDGNFSPCSCSGSGSTNAKQSCTVESLNCAAFSSQGLTGWKLHKLVYDAGAAKRYAEAICLAQQSISSPDPVLVGASHFEASRAWEGLGCHNQAMSSVEASIAARPYGRSGWKETCDLCAQLKAHCERCTAPHEITEDDLIGKWSGTVETTMRIPADYIKKTPASEEKNTTKETFEIVRRNGELISTASDPVSRSTGTKPPAIEPMPMKLSRELPWWHKPAAGEHGALVDRSDPEVSVTVYSFQGDKLKVETEEKGHFGGMSVGVFTRISP